MSDLVSLRCQQLENRCMHAQPPPCALNLLTSMFPYIRKGPHGMVTCTSVMLRVSTTACTIIGCDAHCRVRSRATDRHQHVLRHVCLWTEAQEEEEALLQVLQQSGLIKAESSRLSVQLPTKGIRMPLPTALAGRLQGKPDNRVRLHTFTGLCPPRADHRVVICIPIEGKYVAGTLVPGRSLQCSWSPGRSSMPSFQQRSTLALQPCARPPMPPMRSAASTGLACGPRPVRFFNAIQLHIDRVCTNSFCISVRHQQRTVLSAAPHLPACQYSDEGMPIHACHLQCRGVTVACQGPS